MDKKLAEDFPEESFLAVHDELPIAAAGLLKTDGADAFLMGLITNPIAMNSLRSDAIDALTSHIVQRAEYLGFKRLFSWSKNDGVIERSKKHGFEMLNQVMIGLDLKGE